MSGTIRPAAQLAWYGLCIGVVCGAYGIAAALTIVLVIGAGPVLLMALVGWCAWHIAGGFLRGFNGLTRTTERNRRC